MSAEKNKQLVRSYLDRVVSRGDQTAMSELVSETLVFTSPYTPQPVQGRHGFVQMIAGLRASFPDLKIVEHDTVGEGDLVAARWTASGTHTGAPFAGRSATGNRFEISGMSFYRVRDGHIVEGWVCDDTLGMLTQLGVVPQPA